MNYSGIVVTVPRERTDEIADQLAALSGIQVHVRHEPSGRLVLVLESPDSDSFEASFRRIRDHSGVLAADLVYHFVDHEAALVTIADPPSAARSSEETGP